MNTEERIEHIRGMIWSIISLHIGTEEYRQTLLSGFKYALLCFPDEPEIVELRDLLQTTWSAYMLRRRDSWNLELKNFKK